MGASPLHYLQAMIVLGAHLNATCARWREITCPGIAPRTRHLHPRGKGTKTQVDVSLARSPGTTGRATLADHVLTTLPITISHGYAEGFRTRIQACGADAQ